MLHRLSKPLQGGGKAKASAKCASGGLATFYVVAAKRCDMNPKPSELTMGRVKSAEGQMEARTREPFNTLG